MPSTAVDLFAGPGGWDVAAQRLNLDVTGIEFDRQACNTRRAFGLSTVEGDVRAFGPAEFSAAGLIASPPCQTFSMAGKGAGRAALETVLAAVTAMSMGVHLDPTQFDDERTGLVLEPLRWALEALDGDDPYQWLAFEQVPTVLPVWTAMGAVLRTFGYSVTVGLVYAEQYGVPQTRKRAVLVAHRDKVARLPTPTHSRYHSRQPDRLDVDVKCWLSMAEALGWGMTHRPYPTIACSRTSGGGPDKEKVGGSGARRIIYTEQAAGRWQDEIVRESVPAWAFERPSTTIVGSFRPDIIAAPGWRKAGDGPRQNAPGSIRVSEQEAAVLQTFPADYPWQGSKSKQFQQIGNAVPPTMAEAILAEVTATESADEVSPSAPVLF